MGNLFWEYSAATIFVSFFNFLVTHYNSSEASQENSSWLLNSALGHFFIYSKNLILELSPVLRKLIQSVGYTEKPISALFH